MDWFYELWTKLGNTFEGWLESAVPESAEGWVIYLVLGFLSMLVIVNLPIIGVMAMIYLERRLLGRMQNRLGPNRVGPFGILQPVADAIKILTKEDIVPAGADKIVFTIAPVVFFALALFPVINLIFGTTLGTLVRQLEVSLTRVLQGALSSIFERREPPTPPGL